MCEANPTEIAMLKSAGFSINRDGEWDNGPWNILLDEDFASVSHTAWIKADHGVESFGSVNEALEFIAESNDSGLDFPTPPVG